MAVVALASAAEAQTAAQPPAMPRPALDLSRLRTPFTAPYSAPDARAGDLPRTAIERRLSSDGLTGSLGYLCGIDSATHELEPRGGPASSFGRESTFLGAKLSYAFK